MLTIQREHNPLQDQDLKTPLCLPCPLQLLPCLKRSNETILEMLNQAKSIICLLGLFILRFTLAQTAQTAHITAPPDPASVGVVPGPLFSTDDQGHTNFDCEYLLCLIPRLAARSVIGTYSANVPWLGFAMVLLLGRLLTSLQLRRSSVLMVVCS